MTNEEESNISNHDGKHQAWQYRRNNQKSVISSMAAAA